jgi:membrane carboxypeptidase/penicillin-binding protein PbpC
VSDILADNPARSIEFGTNSPLNIPGKRVSVKTGTSDNKRDNWTIGYTKDYVVTVWVGNNNNAPMSQTLASGITGAAPIWNKVMNNLLATKYTPLVRIPENVIPKQCGGRIEYFIKGTENRNECNYKYNAPSGTPSPTPGH